MDALVMWGVGVVLALQALSSPALDALVLAITQLGGELFFFLLVPLFYWCVDKRFGIRLAVLFVASALANLWLKEFFHTLRPYQIDPRVRLIGLPEATFNFPSFHAQLSTTVWGAVALRARRGWVWGWAVILIGLVSLSRVYLGVHFPHDALGGVLVGIVVLAIYVRVEPWLAPRLAALSYGRQLLASIVAPPLLLVVLMSSDAVAATGMLSGVCAGYVAQRRRVNFSSGGPARQRALRFALGTIGLLAIYLGLRVAFAALAPDEGTAAWFALRYARYFLTGVWAGGLWPMLAVRAGLAAREA